MKNKACHNVDRSAARFGVADGPELCKLIADSIPVEVLRDAKHVLDVGSGCCGISKAIVNRLVKELDVPFYDAILRVHGVDIDLALVNKARRLGFIQTSCVDFLEWQPEMKFDVIVGNPPYGKNASLAVKFLNKAAEYSDHISFVLPRTFRKPSVLNRIDEHLHLVEDVDTPNETFGGTIITCRQKWEKREEKRERIRTYTQHPDLNFVSKAESNVFVGRVGAGPAGKVLTADYDHLTEQHYFLQVTDTVKERLIEIQDTLRQLARAATVGTPSLSKHELISTYVDRFG
jgi:predicted RNA methylase